jgi:hypothetical protein
MDGKGFLLGRTLRSKRIFSKQLWEQKKVTQALQDGNREWITTMATICADGSWIDPAIVFEAKGGLCNAWLCNVDPEKHHCFFTTSLSGWSNDKVGLAWLKNVFERCTKSKARSSYCILILNGHGSHLTEDFFSFCDANKILLHVFPPHSTHSLQPLDVVMFSPLLTLYPQKLLQYLHASQGLIAVAKEDFFLLFWDAYTSSFTRDNILKAFKATGVEPCDVEVILKRFRTPTPTQDEDVEIGQHGDGNSWKDVRNLYNAAVTNKAEVLAKQLKVGMHSLQVNNELLHKENKGLQHALSIKKKRKGKSKTMLLSQQEEFNSKAVFYSPSTVAENRRLCAEQDYQNALKKRQKKEEKDVKGAQRLYNKRIQDEAKARRLQERERKKEEKDAKAEERCLEKERKQQQHNAATLQKSRDTHKKASQATSRGAVKKTRCGGGAAAGASGGPAEPPPPLPPAKITTRGRQIKVPINTNNTNCLQLSIYYNLTKSRDIT